MKQSKPRPNELRTIRKKSGLTQGELAYLLGVGFAGRVSLYERSLQQPSLPALIAYEVAFGVTLHQLFRELYSRTEHDTRVRATRLIGRLGKLPYEGQTEQKCEFLGELVRSPERAISARR